MKDRTLVLGFGNDLAGDDAIGLEIVRALSAEIGCAGADAEIDIEETSESFLVLLDHVGRYRRIFIVDAMLGDPAQVGKVLRFAGGVGGGAWTASLSHTVGLDAVLDLARRAGCDPLPDVVVLGIVIEKQVVFSEHMDERVRAAAPVALSILREELSLVADSSAPVM
jgi:hydrogenase maturation protease